LFLHLRLSLQNTFAGAYHGSGESRTFQLNSGHPQLKKSKKGTGGEDRRRYRLSIII